MAVFTRETLQSAVRVLEILFVITILLQGAAGLSYVLMNRRLQRILDHERSAEQGIAARQIRELEAKSAGEHARAEEARQAAEKLAQEEEELRRQNVQLQLAAARARLSKTREQSGAAAPR